MLTSRLRARRGCGEAVIVFCYIKEMANLITSCIELKSDTDFLKVKNLTLYKRNSDSELHS